MKKETQFEADQRADARARDGEPDERTVQHFEALLRDLKAERGNWRSEALAARPLAAQCSRPGSAFEGTMSADEWDCHYARWKQARDRNRTDTVKTAANHGLYCDTEPAPKIPCPETISTIYQMAPRKGWHHDDLPEGWKEVAFERFDFVECGIFEKRGQLTDKDRSLVESFGDYPEGWIPPANTPAPEIPPTDEVLGNAVQMPDMTPLERIAAECVPDPHAARVCGHGTDIFPPRIWGMDKPETRQS